MHEVSAQKDTQDGFRFLSRNIEQEAIDRGFKIVRYRDFCATDLFTENFLIKDPPYSSIFGTKHDGSGYLIKSPKFYNDVRIEGHFQQSNGSTYAKLPFFMANAKECLPEKEIVFVLDGEEMPSGAVLWMKRQAESSVDKKIRVMTLNEYRSWFNLMCRDNGERTRPDLWYSNGLR